MNISNTSHISAARNGRSYRNGFIPMYMRNAVIAAEEKMVRTTAQSHFTTTPMIISMKRRNTQNALYQFATSVTTPYTDAGATGRDSR